MEDPEDYPEVERHYRAPISTENEPSQLFIQGVWGRDSHLERELAKRIAGSDERLGAAESDKLDATFKGLARSLGRLTNVSRDLGSSVLIVESATILRYRLIDVRKLLRKNASDLFPKTIKKPTSDRKEDKGSETSRELGLKDLPEQFECLAKDIEFFSSCLKDFPVFTDKSLYDALSDLEVETEYLSDLLNRYKVEPRRDDNAMKKYTQDLLARRLEEPMEDVTVALATFIDTGIRAVKSAQKGDAATSLTLSTVATFFSAVTATTLQFSFSDTTTAIQVTVNSLWFCSLVFSVASVVNGLLAYMWKNAKYRSPVNYTPLVVSIWINDIPLIFLIISAAAFSIGLCAFAYSSHQNVVTSILTTLFTAISSVGLVVVTLWFVCEKWAHAIYDGKVKKSTKEQLKWLLEIIPERIRKNPILWLFLYRPSSSVDQQLPAKLLTEDPQPSVANKRPYDSRAVTTNGTDDSDASKSKNNGTTVIDFEEQSAPSARLAHLDPKALFRGLVALKVLVTRNRRIVKSRMERVGSSLLMLNSMKQPKELPTAHETLVRHMQFSPDGKYLATCSWDRKVAIYDLTMVPISHPKLLDHSNEQDLLCHLAWSPRGNRLICKMLRGLSLWTSEGAHTKTIGRERAIESVTWFPPLDPDSAHDAFISVEGNTVRKLGIYGDILDEYDFENTTIHDVAITPDAVRMICVATLAHQADGARGSVLQDRKEEMIMLYNLETRKTESEVPVLGESRNVKLSKDGKTILVSYENKTPPQTWKIRMSVQSPGMDDSGNTGHLELVQTFMPKEPVDFAGPCHFGGRYDELVICAGKDGTMYVWDSRTGFLLHEFDMGKYRSGRRTVDEITSLAWNHESEHFMFCTGHVSGKVEMWTPKQSGVASATQRRRKGK